MTGVGFLVGASQAGKSFLALDMALRIASGAKVLGRRSGQVGCVYVAAEDPMGCRARVAAWRRQFRRDSWTPFHLLDAEINLLDQRCVDKLIETLQTSAEAFDENEQRLGLIVFDTLSRCLPGVDENNSQGMSQAFVALKRICSVTGALVLVLAHFGKAGEERGIRGWSGMDANSDATLTLERSQDDDTLRLLKLHKVKNGMAGMKIGFRLKEIDLGMRDDDGDEINSCVVEYENAPPASTSRKRKAMNVPEGLVFDAIRYLTDNGRVQEVPASWPGVRPWMKALSRTDVRNQVFSKVWQYDGEAENSATKRLSRSLQGLESQRRIAVLGDLIWLI